MSLQYSVPDLMPSVKNALECLDVKQGETGVLLTESTADQTVVGALEAGIRFVGAEVAVITVMPHLLGGLDQGRYSPAVEEALLASDFAVALTTYPLHHSGTGDRLEDGIGLKKGAERFRLRYMDTIGMAQSEAMMTSGRFPTALFYEVMKTVMPTLSEGRQLRFTDDRGSDLTATVSHQEYSPLGPRTRPMRASEFLPWPFGAWVTHDMTACNGVIMWDGCVPFGLFDQPVRLTIKDGFAVSFEGKEDARRLERYLRALPNATYVAELGIGLNPWSRRFVPEPNGIHEMTRRAGNCLLALGAGHRPERFGKSHLDGLCRGMTVTVDGVPFLAEGKISAFDNDQLRTSARVYGDPDVIFSSEGYRYL